MGNGTGEWLLRNARQEKQDAGEVRYHQNGLSGRQILPKWCEWTSDITKMVRVDVRYHQNGASGRQILPNGQIFPKWLR